MTYETLLILHPSHREQANCLSLRASSDHRFIVGALQARRMVVCLFPLLFHRHRDRFEWIVAVVSLIQDRGPSL